VLKMDWSVTLLPPPRPSLKLRGGGLA